HCSLVVHVRTEKRLAKWFKHGHHILGLKRKRFSPPLHGDSPFPRIQCDYYMLSRNPPRKSAQESRIDFSAFERRAADNHLRRAKFHQPLRARSRANSTAYSYFHFVLRFRALAELLD